MEGFRTGIPFQRSVFSFSFAISKAIRQDRKEDDEQDDLQKRLSFRKGSAGISGIRMSDARPHTCVDTRH